VAAFEMGYGLASRYDFNQKRSLVKRALLDVRVRIVHGEHDQVYMYPLTGPCSCNGREFASRLRELAAPQNRSPQIEYRTLRNWDTILPSIRSMQQLSG